MINLAIYIIIREQVFRKLSEHVVRARELNLNIKPEEVT